MFQNIRFYHMVVHLSRLLYLRLLIIFRVLIIRGWLEGIRTVTILLHRLMRRSLSVQTISIIYKSFRNIICFIKSWIIVIFIILYPLLKNIIILSFVIASIISIILIKIYIWIAFTFFRSRQSGTSMWIILRNLT